MHGRVRSSKLTNKNERVVHMTKLFQDKIKTFVSSGYSASAEELASIVNE